MAERFRMKYVKKWTLIAPRPKPSSTLHQMSLSRIPRERREFLADLAENVWQTFSGDVPVFLDTIVEDNGLTMSHGDYGDAFEGLIEHRSGKFHIYINTGRTPAGSPRSRFTLGHELGHFF